MSLSEIPCLPLLVFLAELAVVTIGTVRIIFVSRGMRYLAPLLGFFEVSIWLFAIGQIMRNLTDPGCYLGFASGFTTGTFLGVLLEKKLALGSLSVQIVTARDAGILIARMRAADYGVTSLEGHGAAGPVRIVFTAIRRKDLTNVLALVKDFDANAFYAVSDLQAAGAGIFPVARAALPVPLRLFRSAS